MHNNQEGGGAVSVYTEGATTGVQPSEGAFSCQLKHWQGIGDVQGNAAFLSSLMFGLASGPNESQIVCYILTIFSMWVSISTGFLARS